MKKYKLFAFTFIIAILSMVTVNAREMTASELGQAAIDQYKSSDQDVGYIYVIGEYAFTSQYDIKTEDIMLAAKSIDIKGANPVKYEDGTNLTEAYKKMVINTIRAKVDDDFNISGWEISNAAVGTSNITENQKINIRFIDYVFQPETSEANIRFDKDTEEAYKNYLTKDFGINDLSKLYADTLTYTDGKLSGLMLKYEITKGFPEEDKTGYYLPFVIEVPGLTQNTTVTIKEDKEVTATYDNFDIKDTTDNKIPGIIALWSIPGENGSRTITIIVDIDGENNNEYEPSTYTIDYADLRFQGESKIQEITLNNAHENDKTTLTSWGYDFTKNKDKDGNTPTLTKNGDDFNYKLTGTLVEQKLNETAYGAANADGYYFDFTFILGNNSDKKAVIKALNGDYGKEKTHSKDEYDENGNLTILQRISKDTKCDNGNKDKCIAKFEIDLDGEGKEYYPTIYTIDYSEVTLEKTSFFTVSALGEDNKNEFGDSGEWYDTDKGYHVEVKADETDSSKYKVTGVLPIFDDNDGWEVNEEHIFDTSKNLYYLGLVLKLVNPPKDLGTGSISESTINVKFYHNDDEDNQFLKLYDSDFDSSYELYILKALCENATDGSGDIIPDTEKVFTITVDLDGDAEEYAPYTITIDWSGLVLQAESVGDFGNYEVINSDKDLENDSIAKEDLKKYKYDYTKDSEVLIKTESQPESGHEAKKGLQGKIKEQKLDESSGFQEPNGYFVPIKIEFPGKDIPELDDYKNSWTLILNTEEGPTKEYTPTQAEYNQGWVMVLFKIKDTSDKVIKYSIDYDGSPNKEENKGYNFLPYEYTIKYDDLTFVKANEVKVNGKPEENISIYEGETIPEAILNQLKEEQLNSIDEELQPYRDVAYFTTSDGTTKVDENTTVTSDMIKDGSLDLTTHWNLYANDFITDVIDDLNLQQGKEDGSKSDNFYDKFNFEIDEDDKNNIKVKIVDPETTLNTMGTTSIPGAIAYVLLQGDVKDITFTLNDENSVTFNKSGVATINALQSNEIDTLKGQVLSGIKGVYDKVLGANKDETTTLSALAAGKNNTFKLTIGDTIDNVSLANKDSSEVNKTYTFTFDTSVAVVSTENELKEALANVKITEIYIKNDFELGDINADQKHTLIIDLSSAKRDITIESLNSSEPVTISDTEQTKEGETDKTPVIEVKNGNVTFKNIKLKGATRAITVDSEANVTAINVTAVGSQDTAFDVSGTFTGTELQYKTLDETNDKESYHYPTICGHGNVTVNNVNLTKVDNYKRIVHPTTGKYTTDDFKNPETNEYYKDFVEDDGSLKSTYQDLIDHETLNPPDFLSSTGHTHYYLNSENSVYYEFLFRDSRVNLIIFKYFAKGDTITPPATHYYNEREESKGLHFFISAYQPKAGGKTYVFDGWSESENDNDDKVNTNSEKVSEFKFPSSPSEKKSYYTHFSEGYRVKIPMTINEKKYTGIFGIVKDQTKTLKIQDLITQNQTFSETFNALKQQASNESKKLINSDDRSQEITENTDITSNLSIEIGELQANPGVSYTVGSLNETVMPSENGKFTFPVTIKSDNLQDGISTITITDPNGTQTVKKYSSETEDGIATVSTLNENTITLNLEAIKTAKIKDGNKVYKIAVDVDGSESDDYAIANYTVDYNNTKTLEEVILEAANNTLEAESYTATKDNKIKSGTEKYTYKIDKINKTRYYEEGSEPDKIEQYTFDGKDVDPNSNVYIVVEKSKNINNQVDRPKLNDWTYVNKFSKVPEGINELELLKDFTDTEGKFTDAIVEVTKGENPENTYTVKINKNRLENWLNATYIDGCRKDEEEKNTDNHQSDEASITLKVTLDSNNQYVTKIETVDTFNIKSGELDYNDNKINVSITEINKTTIEKPQKIFAKDEQDATNEDIQDFMNKGAEWWHKTTGSTGA